MLATLTVADCLASAHALYGFRNYAAASRVALAAQCAAEEDAELDEANALLRACHHAMHPPTPAPVPA